jgi:hypothetical protein
MGLAGPLNLRRSSMETIILILAIAMVVPSPLDEVVGNFGRFALALLGLVLVVRWIIVNDQKKDRSLRG